VLPADCCHRSVVDCFLACLAVGIVETLCRHCAVMLCQYSASLWDDCDLVCCCCHCFENNRHVASWLWPSSSALVASVVVPCNLLLAIMPALPCIDGCYLVFLLVSAVTIIMVVGRCLQSWNCCWVGGSHGRHLQPPSSN